MAAGHAEDHPPAPMTPDPVLVSPSVIQRPETLTRTGLGR